MPQNHEPEIEGFMLSYLSFLSLQPALRIIDLFYCLFRIYFTYFCSDLYYFLPSSHFGIFCYFSSSFMCKVRLFVWAFSYFLREGCSGMNFPFRTVFSVFRRFWVVVFSFSFLSRYLLISSLILLLTHSLFKNMLFSLHIFVYFSVFSCDWLLAS